MQELDLIQTFEKDFIAAGKLALKLRNKLKVENKVATGNREIDIVTSADIALQEFILEKLAKSELKKLELVAEEDTPSAKLFAKKSDLVLTLDPIDGTYQYASGQKMFSVVVTIHNKVRPIYTFNYYPQVDWGIKIVNNKCEFFGQKPDFGVTKQPKIIAYAIYGDDGRPEHIPELKNQFEGKGYRFKSKEEITDLMSTTAIFLLDLADGYFKENGSAVDALVVWHFALANNYKIYGKLDLSKLGRSELSGGDSYKGNYLVLR